MQIYRFFQKYAQFMHVKTAQVLELNKSCYFGVVLACPSENDSVIITGLNM